MKKFIYVYLLITSIITILSASNLPASRIVDWGNAGLYSDSPIYADNIITIANSGSIKANIDAAIAQANDSSGTTIIYFPEGVYTITGTILINNVKNSGIIFQGDGPDKTILKFDNVDRNNHCFYISGWSNSEISTTYNLFKGNNQIDCDGGSLTTGDWIVFCEPGFDDDYGSSSPYIGQVSKITNNNPSNNVITLKDNFSKYYSGSNNIWVKKINPTMNIGFENFKIKRTNPSNNDGSRWNKVDISGKTFGFDKCVNCWIKGVESYNCTGYHVHIYQSSHIEVSGCYIHHATNYNSWNGSGYGVVLGNQTTNCLIENNIFKETRHAMLVGTGANSNVFGYNFSYDSEWDYPGYPGDIRLHGRYPYANLFEGNSVNLIYADDTHGDNGYYNTFLRNYQRTTSSNGSYNLRLENTKYSNCIANKIEGGISTSNSNYLYDFCIADYTGQIFTHGEYFLSPNNPNWRS
ncbi:MAG: glycosyl hydrolase family 28-related protein, partial [bacterium]